MSETVEIPTVTYVRASRRHKEDLACKTLQRKMTWYESENK